MAKCISCGKSFLLKKKVKLADGEICGGCLDALGFSNYSPYLLEHIRSADVLRGVEAYEKFRRDKAEAHYDFNIHFADDEKLVDVLEQYQKDYTSPDDKYEGMTMWDIKKSDLYGQKIYQYPPLDVDLSFKFNQDGKKLTAEVYLLDGGEEIFIGYPPKTKVKKIYEILSEKDPKIEAELSGGHYYKLKDNGYVEDEYSDDLKIRVTLDWSSSIKYE